MRIIFVVLFVGQFVALLFSGIAFFFISNETARKILGGFMVVLSSIILLSFLCWLLLRLRGPQLMTTGGDEKDPPRRHQLKPLLLEKHKVQREEVVKMHPDAYWHRDDIKPTEKYTPMTKDVPQRFDALYSLFASSDKSYGLKKKYDFEDYPFAVLALSRDERRHHVFMMRCQSFSSTGKYILENHLPLGSKIEDLIYFTRRMDNWSAIIPIGINEFSNVHQTLMIIEKRGERVSVNLLDPMGDAALGNSASKIFDSFRRFFPSAEFKYLSCGVQVSNVYCVLYTMKFAYYYLEEGANLSSSSIKICPEYSKKYLEENDRLGDLNLTNYKGPDGKRKYHLSESDRRFLPSLLTPVRTSDRLQ